MQLETDYLIIGAGAVGLAFADTLLSETEAHITIVDKRHKPGGHWHDAYPFVTLHQPSNFYGVNSRELSNGKTAKVGLNKGLSEMASGAEILAYFDNVLKDRFLPSGRVQYLPLHDYQGSGKVRSLLTEEEHQFHVNKKTVDCTYFGTNVPSTHTPNFQIEDGVNFLPLNDLTKLSRAHKHYTVIGGGKTGIDAITWLLEHKIEPEKISWVRPRDGWLINRKTTQPGEAFFSTSVGAIAQQMKAIAEAKSIPDLFERLEKAEILLRIDQEVTPKMFHGATVSELELAECRKIQNVIRKGHVKAITRTKTLFEQGEVENVEDTLFIDCSACAVTVRPELPIFKDDLITVQTVRSFQPVFSAAFVAHIEATYEQQTKKNELCKVVPLPNHDIDWLVCTGAQMKNQVTWSQEPGLKDWFINNRLDGFTKLTSNVDKSDSSKMQILGMMREYAPLAAQNLQSLLAQINSG